MPRFTHPITWHLTNSDEVSPGPLRITMRADIPVEIEDRVGEWLETTVVIDTGASYSLIGTRYARGTLNLFIPPPTSVMRLRTATGLVNVPITDGEIHLRFPQLPERTFRLKCMFRDQSADVPPVLGLHNLIDLITIRFDGTPLPNAGPTHPGDGLMGSMEFVFPEDPD